MQGFPKALNTILMCVKKRIIGPVVTCLLIDQLSFIVFALLYIFCPDFTQGFQMGLCFLSMPTVCLLTTLRQSVNCLFDPTISGIKFICTVVCPQKPDTVPHHYHKRRMQGSFACLRGKRGYTGRFNKTIERFVVRAKSFVVRKASCLGAIVVGEYNTGDIAAPDTTTGLDIFCGSKRLPVDDH